MRIGLTLQNNTHELLTVEGSSVLNGLWQTQPLYGDVVEKLSTATYWSKMDERWESGPNSWLIAWIRFGTTKGYIKIGGAYNADVKASGLSEEDRKREIAIGGPNSPFRAHVFVPRLLDATVFVTGVDPDIYVQIFLESRVRSHTAVPATTLGAGSARFTPSVGLDANAQLVRGPLARLAASAPQAPAEVFAQDNVAAAAAAPEPRAQPTIAEESLSELYEQSVPIQPVHTGRNRDKAPFI